MYFFCIELLGGTYEFVEGFILASVIFCLGGVQVVCVCGFDRLLEFQADYKSPFAGK